MIAKNNGQRLLIELDRSLADIGKAAGKSRSIVHKWRHGGALPTPAARAALFSAFGIDAGAWDVALPPNYVVKLVAKQKGGRPRNDSKKPVVESHATDDPDVATKRRVFTQDATGETVPIPPYPDRPTEDTTPVANVQYQLDCIRHDLEYESLSVAGKSKLRADESRAMSMLIKFKKEEELTEDRFVREHPAWGRFTAKLLDALEPYPEASRDVLDALRADA